MTTETLTESPSTGTSSTPTAASNGLSVASIVLSILAIPLGQGVLAIAGIILGFLARSREPGARAIANWGIVVGFVALFGWIVFVLLGVAIALPLITSGFVFGAF